LLPEEGHPTSAFLNVLLQTKPFPPSKGGPRHTPGCGGKVTRSHKRDWGLTSEERERAFT